LIFKVYFKPVDTLLVYYHVDIQNEVHSTIIAFEENG
jgi:hypothetical protein